MYSHSINCSGGIQTRLFFELLLVYAKSGRIATIYIAPRGTFQGFVTGDYGSGINISVVHPDAISTQNPYDELNYSNLPETP